MIDPVEVVGHPDVDPRLPGRGAPVSVGNNSDKRVSDTRNVFFSMVSSQAPKYSKTETKLHTQRCLLNCECDGIIEG